MRAQCSSSVNYFSTQTLINCVFSATLQRQGAVRMIMAATNGVEDIEMVDLKRTYRKVS